MEIYYRWDNGKNEMLRQKRDTCFEQIVMHIGKGDLADIIANPNQNKYPGQKILIVDINGYIWLVPFVQERENVYFLKTTILSRKATKKYLRGKR